MLPENEKGGSEMYNLKKVRDMLEEASAIALELNRVNHGRCDLVTWVCALQMASRIVVAAQNEQEPENAANLNHDIEYLARLMSKMDVLVVQEKPTGVVS